MSAHKDVMTEFPVLDAHHDVASAVVLLLMFSRVHLPHAACRCANRGVVQPDAVVASFSNFIYALFKIMRED